MSDSIKVILIVGPARSGTTLLGTSLITDATEYFVEPNLIWRHGNAWRRFDELKPHHLNSRIKNYIRKYFYQKAKKNGKSIILEKTPSNCLRLDFIKAVFPEAKYIFINRDLKKIQKSAYKKWTKEDDKNTERLYGPNTNHKKRYLLEKIHSLQGVSVYDLFFYIPRALSLISFLFLGKERKVWGPRYHNIYRDLKKQNIFDVCYKQAEICKEKINIFKKTLPKELYTEIAYIEGVGFLEEEIYDIREFINK